MKKIFCLASFLCLLQIVHAQTGVRLYTYKQQVSSGVKPETVIGEDQVMVQTMAKTRHNLWIYFSHPKSPTVKITGLYINGKKYKTKQSSIPQTPVLRSYGDTPEVSKNITLVPKTSNTVLYIEPAGVLSFSPSASLKKLITQNEVVMSYSIKGKTYYISAKKMKELSPAVMV